MKERDQGRQQPFGDQAARSVRPRLTQNEIVYMLAAAARSPMCYLAIAPKVTVDMFDPAQETHLILFWKAVTAVAAAASDQVVPEDPRVAADLLRLACDREVAWDRAGAFYSPDVVDGVISPDGLIAGACALTVTQDVEDAVLQILIKFLAERTIDDPLRLLLSGMGPDEVIADPAVIISALERQVTSISAAGADPGQFAVVDKSDFRPKSADVFPTGLDWLDEYMGGGHAPGECYVVLGGTGSGKTGLGVQIAVEGARIQSVSPNVDRQGGYWYYFSYELSEDEIRERVYIYGAKVDWTEIRNPFSTSAGLKAYEHSHYVNAAGSPPLGERERIDALNRELAGPKPTLLTVDFSGTYGGYGRGGVDELITYLRRQRSMGRRIAGVVVDYAGLCVRRYIGEKNLRPSDEYPLLNGFGDRVRSEVSIPFKCASWVFHQLQGSMASKSPTADMHHMHASGARNIGDNADFAFWIGNRDKKTSLVKIGCSKSRRARPFEEPQIIHYDGRFGAFTKPRESYVVDRFTGQIVRRDDASKFDFGPGNGPGGGPTPNVGDGF